MPDDDVFSQAFQTAAEHARRLPMDELLRMLYDRVGECTNEHEHGSDPDVLILIRCDERMTWAHNGLTDERAVYMSSLAIHAVHTQSGDYSADD